MSDCSSEAKVFISIKEYDELRKLRDNRDHVHEILSDNNFVYLNSYYNENHVTCFVKEANRDEVIDSLIQRIESLKDQMDKLTTKKWYQLIS